MKWCRASKARPPKEKSKRPPAAAAAEASAAASSRARDAVKSSGKRPAAGRLGGAVRRAGSLLRCPLLSVSTAARKGGARATLRGEASQASAARCGTPRAAAASLFLISYSNFSAPTPPARHWSASAAGTSSLLASDWPARNTEAAVLIIIFRWLELALGAREGRARERARERERRGRGCRNLRPARKTALAGGSQHQRQLSHSSVDFLCPPTS